MNTPIETKTCAMCAETIKAAAKKCPFCQTRLGRWVRWHVDLVPSLVALCVMAMAVAFLVWVFPEDANPEGRDFAGHRGELGIVGQTLGRDQAGPGFWLSGFVTNQGSYPWRVCKLEVRLLDAQGSLVDVLHPKVNDPFVVEPRHEHAFRVGLGTLPWTNFTGAPQVRVQTARDGRLSSCPD
jgi:hypothetical protein